MGFHKAERTKQRARVVLEGYAGSGKTFTALRIATALAQGGKIAVIDTEHGSASLYVDEDNPDGGTFEFDADELETFSPERYIKSIAEAGRDGYAVLVIDSMSHAWDGKDGILEGVDGNFGNWKKASPKQRRFIEAILSSPCHVVATLRTKAEFVVEKDERTKKNVVRKVGTKAIQKDNTDYEFTVVGMLDEENVLSIKKTRCPALKGKHYHEAGKDVADVLLSWLSKGATPAKKPAPVDDAAPSRSEPVACTEQALVADEYRIAIEQADSETLLEGIGGRIAAENFPRDIRSQLGALYKARKAQLTATAAE